MANGIPLLAASLIYAGIARAERDDDMIEKSAVLHPEVNAADHFDAQSKTCGIAEAIAALPASGGRVRLPAGTYLLRDSVYVPSRVSLVGDGPATVLAIRPLQVATLAQNVRKGQRVARDTWGGAEDRGKKGVAGWAFLHGISDGGSCAGGQSISGDLRAGRGGYRDPRPDAAGAG